MGTNDWDVPASEAIPRLLEQHGGRLYGVARRLCGSPEEAEDLVQEVFLNAFRKWDQFERRSSPFSWLYSIAAHACQRMHRKRAGEPENMGSFEDDLPFGRTALGVVPSGTENGALAAIQREGTERIEQAILGLPIEFRLPLVLKDIVGFSIEEIAGILGLKTNTVKTRLHRARLKVRAALEHALPVQEVPEAAYSKQVCLDLLRAKQESIDHGVPMPGAKDLICQRCRTVFDTMDLAAEICQQIGEHDLPAELRRLVLQSVR